MRDSDFINLYRSNYQRKAAAIRNRAAAASIFVFGGFALVGLCNDRTSILGIFQGFVAGLVFNYFLQNIVYQQLRHPKVARPSLHLTVTRTTDELGKFFLDTILYFAASAAFFSATSGFSNPEHFWPIVPLPDDEGYPRLHRNFVIALLHVFFMAIARSFCFLYFQRNFVFKNSKSSTEVLITIPRMVIQSSVVVGASLVISNLLSSYGYDLLYDAWLFFQHILYSRSVEISNSFLRHLALTGLFLNIFWMVTDELVSSSLVEHLDREIVVKAGVRTLLSGLDDSNGNDDYVRVFCAAELLHHSETNSTFRREIFGRPANHSELPAQSIWPYVCRSLLSILNQLSSDVKALTAEAPPLKPKAPEAKFFKGAVPISDFFDKSLRFGCERISAIWPHANEERLHLTQFWAHISLALMYLVTSASIEDQFGIMQWDIQEVLRTLLEIYDSLDLYLEEKCRTSRDQPSGPDVEDAKYLINAITQSCNGIVCKYENCPGSMTYLPLNYICRTKELRAY